MYLFFIIESFDYVDGGNTMDLTEDGKNIALNFVHLYNGNSSSVNYKIGEVVKPTFFYNTTDYSLNMTAYEDVAPLHITPFFVAAYASSFLSIAAVLSQVALWYGPDIKRQFVQALRQVRDDADAEDIHCKMMDEYQDIPDWMYLAFLGLITAVMMYVALFTPFRMPWWAVLLSMLLSIIFIMPVGVINAISGQGIYLNVVTEFVIGLLIPGDTIAVMAFKSLGTNNLIQAMTLLTDLKLGHYLHIPPIAMVGCQMYGTLVSSFVSTGATWLMITKFNDLIQPEGTGGWKATTYKTFFNAGDLFTQILFSIFDLLNMNLFLGAIWGAIAPARFWGIGSIYSSYMYCFLIGFIIPIIPWLINKYVYKSRFWPLLSCK